MAFPSIKVNCDIRQITHVQPSARCPDQSSVIALSTVRPIGLARKLQKSRCSKLHFATPRIKRRRAPCQGNSAVSSHREIDVLGSSKVEVLD